MMKLKDRIRDTIEDWKMYTNPNSEINKKPLPPREDIYKYLDTTVPKHVDREAYYDLKYTNRERVYNFTTKYKVNRNLLYKIAIHDLMQHTDKEILNKLSEYEEKLL